MELLIACVVVVVVLGLLVYCVDLIPIPAPFNNVLKVLLLLIGVLWLLDRSGILH